MDEKNCFCCSSSLIIILNRICLLAQIYKEYIIDFLPIKHSGKHFVDKWIILSKHFFFFCWIIPLKGCCSSKKTEYCGFVVVRTYHWLSMTQICQNITRVLRRTTFFSINVMCPVSLSSQRFLENQQKSMIHENDWGLKVHLQVIS